MSQTEITAWEKTKMKAIIGWQIEYGEEYDTITFFLHDKNKVTFKRDKP